MEYMISGEAGFLEVRTHGRAEPAGFAAYLDEAVARPDWGSRLLVDHSGLDAANLTVAQIQEIADQCVRRRGVLGRARCALVAPGAVPYGLCRMWGVFVEDLLDVDAQVFRTREEAQSWLQTEP